MRLVERDNESSGFPGSWLVADEKPKNRNNAREKQNAAVLRILKQVSGILSKEYPGDRLVGTIVFRDILIPDSSASMNHDDCELEVLIDISSDVLWASAEHQKKIINEILNIGHLSRIENQQQMPLTFFESEQPSRLVQFLTIGSMFDKRESDLCCVPPAAFYLAQPLLDNGFEISVDSIEIETFSSDLDFQFHEEKAAISGFKQFYRKDW